VSWVQAFIALAAAVVTFLVTTAVSPVSLSAAAVLLAACALLGWRMWRKNPTAEDDTAPVSGHTTGRSIPQTLKYEIFQESNGYCGICTEKIKAGQDVEVDHKIPYSLGGETVKSNLWVVHKKCNRAKGNRFVSP
jgi:HNH endonuclease